MEFSSGVIGVMISGRWIGSGEGVHVIGYMGKSNFCDDGRG